jgi:hypothetical protein
MPSSISISPKKINYGDKFATSYLVEFEYSVGSNANNARLIVVSKPDSLSEFDEIQHYVVDVNDTTTTLQLFKRVYDVFIQVNGEETCQSVHGLLDLTDLPGQPTATYLKSYSNSIVLTTNVNTSTYDNPRFIVDVFNSASSYGNGCVKKLELTPDNSDVEVDSGGNYVLHICDLNANTLYLIVYHVESEENQNDQTVLHVGKETDSISRRTLDTSSDVSGLTIAFYPTGAYPADQTNFLSPQGLQLDWTSSSDPNCDDSNTYYKIERQHISLNTWVTLKDEVIQLKDTGNNTYIDEDNGLVAGNAYRYYIYPGKMNNGTITWSENPEEIAAPYYTTPDALSLSVDGTDCGSVTYVKTSNNNVVVNWNSPNTYGYTLHRNNVDHAFAVDSEELNEPHTSRNFTFTDLTYGQSYTKSVSYKVTIDDARDLDLPEPPYNVPSSSITFVPYTTPDVPEGLDVSINNEYTSCDSNAVATFSWNSVSPAGIDGSVTYNVSVTEKNNSYIIDTNTTTNTSYEFTLESGKEYTFYVSAKQEDNECEIYEESESNSIDKIIKNLSGPVEELEVSYKNRVSTNIVELSQYDEVAPFDMVTNCSDSNKIIISANFPECQSWDTSEYYMNITPVNSYIDVVSDVLVGEDGVTTSPSIFNSNGLEYTLDTELLEDNTSYRVTVTPKIKNFPNMGDSAYVNFDYFVVPEVTTVGVEVNVNETITVGWNNLSYTDVHYDVYIKIDDGPINFYRRVNTNTLTVVKPTSAHMYGYNPSLIINSTYTFYVRAWKEHQNNAYFCDPVASATITYWEPPELDNVLPAYDDLVTRVNVQANVSENLLLSPIPENIHQNGVLTVTYQLQCQKATSIINTSTISNNLDNWVDFGASTTNPVLDLSNVQLTSVGYYNFRLKVVSYEDRNNSIEITPNPEIVSNESDLFFMSDPLLTSISNSFAGNSLTVTATAFNNWSNVSTGLAVFIPNNQDEYVNNTLQLYEVNVPVTRSAKLALLLDNNITEVVQFGYPNEVEPRFRPIQNNFVVLTNSVGLSHLSE